LTLAIAGGVSVILVEPNRKVWPRSGKAAIDAPSWPRQQQNQGATAREAA
jgi:hypothetical protein